LKYAGETAVIDTLLLSCRVLGRHVEDALLGQCIQLAHLKGCRILSGEYLPTAKNGQVREFYSARGFARRDQGAVSDGFELDLTGELPQVPDVFLKIVSEVGVGDRMEQKAGLT
jgi:predicted enzyme involved in methoxymalonyl-ACP biosynthesis